MKVIRPNTLPTTLAGFARASTATYVDDAGVLQTAGVDVPRWERGRLLVEGAGTNLVLDSDVALPSVSSTGHSTATVLALRPTGLSGNVTQITTGVAEVHCRYGSTGGADMSSAYAGGVWARAVSGTVFVRYDVNDGTTQEATLTTTWVRLSASSGALLTLPYRFLDVVIPAGTAGRQVQFFGAQVVSGSDVGSYIPTTTAPATRAADVLTGSGLLYSTATAEAAAAYAAGTTYAAGAQVQFDRSVYQSLQAANTGHQPDTSPTWWARLGPVNPWAMFDDQVSTQTAGTAPLRVSFEAGAFDSLAVLAVDAATVTLVVTDGAGGPEVYRRTVGMGADVVTNWYEYFYADLDYRRTQALFFGVPLMGSAVAHLEVTGSGTVRVGHVAWGRMKPVGNVRYGVRAGIRDFSRKDTDDLGVTTFVRRANSKTLTAQLEVQKSELNRTQNLLTALRATPVVWVGSDDPSYSDLMVVFGFYRDFYGSVDYPTKAIYSLEIEGLT